MYDPHHTDAFLSSLAAAYRQRRDTEPALAPSIGELLAGLDGARAWHPKPRPKDHPAISHLSELLARAEQGPMAGIARSLPPLLPHLTWINRYEDGEIAPGFSRGFAFCEIAGADGLVQLGGLRCGLILMAPRVFYPLHQHPAVELYLVLAGTGEWLRGDEPWTPRPPGSFILHDSNMGHAMRSGEEPVLALWAWHGDLASPVVFPGHALAPDAIPHWRDGRWQAQEPSRPEKES